MRIELVIFDFDGTLINSESGICQAIEKTVTAIGLAPEAVEQWRQMIGIPLGVQLSHLLPPDRQGEIEASIALYREYYAQIGPYCSDPFPGIESVLKWLQPRLPMAIASSKRRDSITQVLDHQAWQEMFNPIISPAEVIHPKPHPESIHKVLEAHSTSPAQTLMIGDSVYDVEMAKRAGVETWGVDWGIHGRERLQQAGADWVCLTPEELLSHLHERVIA